MSKRSGLRRPATVPLKARREILECVLRLVLEEPGDWFYEVCERYRLDPIATKHWLLDTMETRLRTPLPHPGGTEHG